MFRYIDLFCGIGGFHQGMERVADNNGFRTEWAEVWLWTWNLEKCILQTVVLRQY